MAFVSFDMAAINFLTTTLEKQDPLVHRSPPRFPSWPPLTRYDQLHRQFSTISLPLTRFLGSPSFPSQPQIFLRPLFFACFPCRRFYTPPRRCVATLSPLQRIKKEIVNWVSQCFHLEKDHRFILLNLAFFVSTYRSYNFESLDFGWRKMKWIGINFRGERLRSI